MKNNWIWVYIYSMIFWRAQGGLDIFCMSEGGCNFVQVSDHIFLTATHHSIEWLLTYVCLGLFYSYLTAPTPKASIIMPPLVY